MLLGLTSEDTNAQTNEQIDLKLPQMQHPAVKQIILKANEQKVKAKHDENEDEISLEVAKTGKQAVK